MTNLTSIDELLKEIKDELTPPEDKQNTKMVSTIFACNSSGKTRLSKLISEKHKGEVLYYNAYTEDLFSWDNNINNPVLKIIKNDAWIFETIQNQQLENQIVENFQKFTGFKYFTKF